MKFAATCIMYNVLDCCFHSKVLVILFFLIVSLFVYFFTADSSGKQENKSNANAEPSDFL